MSQFYVFEFLHICPANPGCIALYTQTEMCVSHCIRGEHGISQLTCQETSLYTLRSYCQDYPCATMKIKCVGVSQNVPFIENYCPGSLTCPLPQKEEFSTAPPS